VNERLLFRLSAIIFIVGVLSLFLVLLFLSPIETTISGLENFKEGDYVKVSGVVSNIFFSESGASFNMTDETGTVKAFIFASMIRSMLSQGVDILSLNNGDHISVAGALTYYKNELEIIPKSYEDVVLWN
jgi:DNA/RNA endonuclease YhcR with UshA esterase domain